MAAHGARFHVVVAQPTQHSTTGGTPPLVVLLHDVLQDWWSWRHQLPALAAAGYRAAALDLRGAGASDRPPRGYDTPTLSADVGGVVRALGAGEAVVVGLGTGGALAWSMPALQPRTTRAVGALSAAPPLQRTAGALAPARLVARWHEAAWQLPVLPERRLQRGRLVAELRGRGAGPGWPSPEEAEHYAQALREPAAAHSALEHVRWLVRSRARRDGRRFRAAVDAPVHVPVLHVAGAEDRLLPPAAARARGRHVPTTYRFEVVPGAGHHLPEETPDAVSSLLLDWLAGLLPGPSTRRTAR